MHWRNVLPGGRLLSIVVVPQDDSERADLEVKEELGGVVAAAATNGGA